MTTATTTTAVINCAYCQNIMALCHSKKYLFFMCPVCGATSPKVEQNNAPLEEQARLAEERATHRLIPIQTNFDEIVYSPEKLTGAMTELFALNAHETNRLYHWLREAC